MKHAHIYTHLHSRLACTVPLHQDASSHLCSPSCQLQCLTAGVMPMQLRNLLWATSKHDLYFMHDHCVKHWNSLTRQTTEVTHVNSSQLFCCTLSICDIPHFAIACKQIYFACCTLSICDIPHFAIACKQIYFACCTPPSHIIWHACLLQSRH